MVFLPGKAQALAVLSLELTAGVYSLCEESVSNVVRVYLYASFVFA